MPSEQPPSARELVSYRRSILRALGVAAGASGFAAGPAAGGSVGIEITISASEDRYTVEQDGHTVEVEAFAGDAPVEELYDLRIPEEYDGDNGATDPGEGPYFMSVGTRDLQRESTTITFLYDGPNGLSLVVVHDADDGDGGSVTWTVSGDLDGSEWLVRDDYYVDPETGEPADTNYDNWRTDEAPHEIDWTWADIRGDGGALGYLGEDVDLTVDPAYNEAAALYDEHYSGTLDAWQFLSGDPEDPDRHPLALDEPVRIRSGGERDDEREGGTAEADGDRDDGGRRDPPGRGPPEGGPPGQGPPDGEPPGLGPPG